MSDRIAVMHRGRVEQLGSAEELYERPRTRFVADFIGTTNLLAGTVEEIAGPTATVRLKSGDACAVGAAGLRIGAVVEVSLRPESITVARSAGGPQAGTVAGRVEQVAYLGSNVQYQVRTAGGQAIAVVASKAGERYEIGATVDVAWAPDAALVLAGTDDRKEEEASA